MINRYYTCDSCNYYFEVRQDMDAPLKKKCPQCGKMKLYQDLTGQHAFVYHEPTTIGHLGERNRERAGKYELDKLDQKHGKNKKKTPAPWYNKDGKNLPKELSKLDTKEKQKKYIMTGEGL